MKKTGESREALLKTLASFRRGDFSARISATGRGIDARIAEDLNEILERNERICQELDRVSRAAATHARQIERAQAGSAPGAWGRSLDSINLLISQMDALHERFNELIRDTEASTRKSNEQDWLKTNIAKFTGMMQGQRDLFTLAELLLSELTPLVNAQHGSFYIAETREGKRFLKLLAGYAISREEAFRGEFRIGEGLVGQCAKERARILATNVPGDYIRIQSSLGHLTPLSILVLPVLFEGDVKAVIELASVGQFNDVHLAFLDQLTQSVGIVLNTIAATMRTEQLLKQSQALAEELQSQQLRLQQTNAELQEKAQLLAAQNNEVEAKNLEVELAKKALEEKAEQLSLTSKYKSEFLANMSHELRTPLNNLLILARMLSENAEKNLTSKQVKFAETIHTSGSDLLALISDILDLSKIESGKMDVDVGGVRLGDLQDYCAKTFRHVAEGKGIDLSIELGDGLKSEVMHTDAKRLQQVLKNLLSNALKFTDRGSVRLTIDRVRGGWTAGHSVLDRAKSVISFSVTDTGIGIPFDKQKIIFEAFQQADGTTSRKYGGTGLGLSISRELSRLLGGEIQLDSSPGMGSTFTLFLPQTYLMPASAGEALSVSPILLQSVTPVEENRDFGEIAEEDGMEDDMAPDDDRQGIEPGDAVLLVIESDVAFSRMLSDLAHEHGFKVVAASRGADAIALARRYHPAAITLEVALPDMAGWIILDRLKHDPMTRHVPVHVITGDENRRRGLSLGALAYVEKSFGNGSLGEAFRTVVRSAQKRKKSILFISPEGGEFRIFRDAVDGPDLEMINVSNGRDAIQRLKSQVMDGVIISLELEDGGAFQIVEAMLGRSRAPVIIAGRRPLTEDEESELHRLSSAGAVRIAYSPERLLEESVLLFHRDEESLSVAQRRELDRLRQHDPALAGKTVLIVDDDVRNIFALTSLLEDHHLKVLHAENGQAGIELLRTKPEIDLVLMDVMMPEMDGYETMTAIRREPAFGTIPIIALTAKAMKGDIGRCIEAGASDYITKPVDLEHLFSVLRVWTHAIQEKSTQMAAHNA